ncbi:hypothetical protein Tco_1451448 [Tanacetum coccineum]
MRLKHGRKIADLDADAKEKEVAKKEVSTVEKEATTANAPTTTIDELTLAQTLIEINAAKPKVVTSAATTTTTTRPKARGVVVQEPSEFKTTSSPLQASQLPHAKDKGKAIMVEPKRPLKKKDQVALDEEMPRNLEAQMQAELIEEERLASETRIEESSKRTGDELKSDKSKKQKIDEHVEAEKDDNPEEEEMKKHMEIV